MRPLLTWFRVVGISGLFIGGVALVQDPHLFWWAVGLCYGGLSILLIDLYFERMRRTLKSTAASFLLILGTGFSFGVVFVSTPVSITPFFISAERMPGDDVAGIKWQSYFSKLDIFISNDSERSYDDVYIRVIPDLYISQAAVSEHNCGGDVSVELVSAYVADYQDSRFQLIATSGGCRVRISHFLPHAHVNVVLAVVTPLRVTSIKGNRLEDSCVDMPIDDDEGESYHAIWGYPTAPIFGPRPVDYPCVRANGYFTAAQRINKVRQRACSKQPIQAIHHDDFRRL